MICFDFHFVFGGFLLVTSYFWDVPFKNRKHDSGTFSCYYRAIILSCEHKPMAIKQPYIWGCKMGLFWVHNTQFFPFTKLSLYSNWQWLLTCVSSFFFRPHLTHQLCLSPDSAGVTFFLRSGKISSPPSCEPPSPCINNVSSSTEESLFLRSGVGYKEESRCRNQERGAEVAPFSGGLLTEIGCFLNRSAPVSAGPGSDSASHSSRIS